MLEPEPPMGVEFRTVTVTGPTGDVGPSRGGYSTFGGSDGDELVPLVPASTPTSSAVTGDDTNTSFIRAVLMDASIAGG